MTEEQYKNSERQTLTVKLSKLQIVEENVSPFFLAAQLFKLNELVAGMVNDCVQNQRQILAVNVVAFPVCLKEETADEEVVFDEDSLILGVEIIRSCANNKSGIYEQN